MVAVNAADAAEAIGNLIDKCAAMGGVRLSP